ncbi:hypothetical protein [Proteiniphilum sp.]|uniref:IS1634 family transposase n=1 Tax=Proteiniphilum sp. TaxID=1926877 RepID=UPI003319055B
MDGMPLAFEINPGNTSEQGTMLPLEKKLNGNFKISKIVVCTDAGLSSYENRKGNNVGKRSFISQASYTPEGELAPMTSYTLDMEMVEQEERFDGYYGVSTDLSDNEPSILKYNGFRWKLEDCFRVLKTDFEARPVFLQRDDRIKAHFLTCFLSLLIIRLLEKKVNRAGQKFSVRKISDTLAGMDFCSIPGEGFVPTYTRTTLTDHLHASAGFRTDYQIITKKEMRKIIASTRKKDENNY